MRTKGILFLALSSLAACSANSAKQSVLDTDITMGDMSTPQSDFGSPSADLAARIVTQCGKIPVLGLQGQNTTAACLGCIASACCAEGINCGSEPSCTAYRNCKGACNASQTCLADCTRVYLLFRRGSWDSLFETCRDTQCNPACNDLSCVGNVDWPNPAQASYSMRIYAQNFPSGGAVQNVLVKVCPPGDAACLNPTAMGTTNASGRVTLPLPVIASGLNGFLEFSAPGYMTTLLFVSSTDNIRFWNSGELWPYMVSQTRFNLFAVGGGVTPDPNRAYLGFLTGDCGSNRTAGVSVTASNADAQTVTAYSAGGLLSKTATQTDSTAFGFILNLPPGAATVTGSIGPTRIGSQNVLFRAGALTTCIVEPTP